MVFIMRPIHLLVFVNVFLSVLSLDPAPHVNEDSELYQKFQEFQTEFKKTYPTAEEAYERYQIFKSNHQAIFKHKVLNPKADYGVTFFSDLTSEEFESTYLKMKSPAENFDSLAINFLNLQDLDLGDMDFPQTFDWREKGINETVESQGVCWSCWAFTAVTNIESLYYIKYGEKIKLSEQQLIDCDTKNDGCKGGLMTTAYDYIMQAGGLMLEKDYPYADKKQDCAFNKSKAVVNIQGYVRLTQSTKEITKALLKVGPLGAGLNGRFLQFYKGGVLDNPACNSDLTHAVVIVGYGVEETKTGKEEYWILKNEWGNFWGEKGYFRVKKTEGEDRKSVV